MITLRIAAVLLWLNGVGFGMFIPAAIQAVGAGRPLPMVLGFKAYGGGPFEGSPAMVPLLAAFLVVCVLEVVAGLLLWGGSKAGAVLALALIPVGAFFWWGFFLPLAPIGAVIRAILIVAAWSSLR